MLETVWIHIYKAYYPGVRQKGTEVSQASMKKDGDYSVTANQKPYLILLKPCQVTEKRGNSGCCSFIFSTSCPHTCSIRVGELPQPLTPACPRSQQQSEVCCKLSRHLLFSCSLRALFAFFPLIFSLFSCSFPHTVVLLLFLASSPASPIDLSTLSHALGPC